MNTKHISVKEFNEKELLNRALNTIFNRYNTEEYRAGIESIISEKQKIYGVIDIVHIKAVLKWVQELWGKDCPLALQIAAAGHDWDRAFESERDRLEDYPGFQDKPVAEWYDVHKAMHSANTARILSNKLQSILPAALILDIVYLVLHHEIGGKKDGEGNPMILTDQYTNKYDLNIAANVLQQADSLAFFDVLDIYVEWKSVDKIKQKVSYMYQRISDNSIKEKIKKMEFTNQTAKEIVDNIVNLNSFD